MGSHTMCPGLQMSKPLVSEIWSVWASTFTANNSSKPIIRPHKRIHHSPNTRTCKELLLTRVNRQHKLYLEHERWTKESLISRLGSDLEIVDLDVDLDAVLG